MVDWETESDKLDEFPLAQFTTQRTELGHDSESKMLPQLWSVVLGWSLTVVIVLGNGLVIYLIATRRRLRTTTNWFVLSLAIADFGVGLLYYPRYYLSYVGEKTRRDAAYYRIAFCVTNFLLCASVTSLCVLTLDRYVAVVKPMKYVVFMTKRRVVLLIFTAWGAAIPALGSCTTFKFIEWKSKETSNLMGKCLWVILGGIYLLACMFLLFCTAKLFLIARRMRRRDTRIDAQLAFNYSRPRRRLLKRRELVSAKLVGMMVAFFVISSSVDIFITLSVRFRWWSLPDATLFVLFTLARNLKLINSAVNPVVYALYKNDIWMELKLKQRSSTVERRQPDSYPLHRLVR